ncbi:SRPBCC family protein [Schumannella luteola]
MTRTSATATALAAAMPDATWSFVSAHDPAQYYPSFGPLPAVIAVSDQTGPWTVVGQSRMLHLSDGGTVVETITDADSPTYFAYNLSAFRKLFGRLVSGARAEWRLEREGDGTRIRWIYTFHPKRGARPLVALIVQLWWSRYMRRVLPRIAADAGR